MFLRWKKGKKNCMIAEIGVSKMGKGKKNCMIAEIGVSKMEKGKKNCMIAEIGVSKMKKGKKNCMIAEIGVSKLQVQRLGQFTNRYCTLLIVSCVLYIYTGGLVTVSYITL